MVNINVILLIITLNANDLNIQIKKQRLYPYLNQQKHLFLPIIAYTLSTTKLEIRAK
jgi:hypothetical protein